ncbi:hypothetical protein Ahy_B10g103866 [Arachis hypogaea]|uniref:Uncharacterized protein n=1 Tax=Arachis hypogaea TaxID=3818 RepID=A0A444X494_ARAHY|nr:hypothetical protein Ahy_B10g103866 [Arachis hypogaea]
MRSGFVLKHSIDVGAGVIDADRFLCLASLRSQILDLGSSFLASAVDTACKAGEVVFVTCFVFTIPAAVLKWHPDRKQLRRNSKQSSKPILLLDWEEEGHCSEAEIASLRAAFTQEVAVWHKLDHPNVTKGLDQESEIPSPKELGSTSSGASNKEA